MKSARRTSLNVRNIRLALGLTQMEFASELGVSLSAVSKWECGIHIPTLIVERGIRNMAATYGLNLHTMRPFDRSSLYGVD